MVGRGRVGLSWFVSAAESLPRRLLAAMVIVLIPMGGVLSTAGGGASPTSGLKLFVLARAIAPGEPFRVVVRSAGPLADVRCRFRGRELAMIPSGGEPGLSRLWEGWGMVGLLEAPGSSRLEIEGRTSLGQTLSKSLEIDVTDKAFPTERLTVQPRYATPPEAVQSRIRREKARLARIYGLRTGRPFATRPFIKPVPGEPTSPFGVRRVFNGKPRDPHSGLDLKAAPGTPVRASGAGRVVLADDLYYSGKLVILDHGAGLFTLYAHLSQLRVREGDELSQGQILGLSGSTGRVTGPHLHWGAKIGERPFDPRALLDPALWGHPSPSSAK